MRTKTKINKCRDLLFWIQQDLNCAGASKEWKETSEACFKAERKLADLKDFWTAEQKKISERVRKRNEKCCPRAVRKDR